MSKLIEELKWRGLIQDITPGTAGQLEKGKNVMYIGFDPTAPSLTIGNFVTVILLMHIQKAGHKPIALVGGATGMIGDPSGKSEERNFLDEETLILNQKKIENQLRRFLDFEHEANPAEIVNNYDWYKDISVLSFLRNAGKHLTVNYMMAKDSVKSRLERGISYTEFSYQLMQAWDFYVLAKDKDCKLQAGGADQWGNITAGIEMVRRKLGTEANGFTCPLLTRQDGSKFGKSEGKNLWLDPEMTSPYQFYQFWINCTDEEAVKFIKIFTFLDQADIEEKISTHQAEPHLRLLQKSLAEEVTKLVHGEEGLEQALNATKALFGKGNKEALMDMDAKTLISALEGVNIYSVSKNNLSESVTVTDLLSESSGIFSSKGEVRKLIAGGGLSINKEKLNDANQASSALKLIANRYILVQKGKKNYYLIEVS